ncbi:MAG TPA: DUF3943 domain-containing protein [Vicinamibacterales bacterium]
MSSATGRGLVIVLACGLGAACAARAGGHKSYLLPAVEIVAMDAGINVAARYVDEPAHYEISGASIRRNLTHAWVVDDDPFEINQAGHPYQGAMYHGIARANGLNYWQSMAYTFGGSVFWEIVGETTPPSFNDQISTGIGGSFLGEPLYRVSRLLLERADRGPGIWRTLASILVSPSTGLNHVLVGNPDGSFKRDAVPFSDIRVELGTTAVATGTRSLSALSFDRPHLGLSMDYGYPGNASYRHERPFDYFRVEADVSSEGLDRLSTRGLIAGADYDAGRLAGMWGLYGSYDYFLPDDFRFSSTAFSIGTTLQASLSESLVIQSSGLFGAGYAAARALGQRDDRDYHYGIAPQATVNLRFITGTRAALDLTARQYFISNVGGFNTGQNDQILIGDASLAIRLAGKHALGLNYQLAGRSSEYLELPDESRSRSRVGVFYTFLGSGGFGAVPSRRD